LRAAEVRGLPFYRAYSLDDIGKVPRGARIGFDSFGRFAVMYDGIYAVLNDTAWVDRVDPDPKNRTLMTTLRVADGTYFYGGRASWGIAEQTREGTLRAHPLVPPDAPAWTTVTAFNEVLTTRTGVYFFDLNGVIYWDFKAKKNFFFELPRVTACFEVGERVLVSCQDRTIREIFPASGSIQIVDVVGLSGQIIERAIPLGGTTVLLALEDGRLLTYDGGTVNVWAAQQTAGIDGRVLALTRLLDGGVAVSIAGKGISIFAADGSLRWRLPLGEFQLVGAMAANEPGVLWAFGENAIYKLFYNSPLTSFSRPLGLTVSWPEIDSWNGRLVVCSGGALLEAESGDRSAPTRFAPLSGAPDTRVTSMAAQGPHLIVGDANGVLAAGSGGAFERIAHLENVAKVEFIGPGLCVALGSREIAALRYQDGRWTECAARIAGVGDAPVRTTVRQGLWIEMGGDNVARLTLVDGILKMDRIALPWSGGQWTNVGAVGPIVILSGSTGNRTFYDETRGALCEAPALDAVLRRSPSWIARVTQDETGTLWATHSRGIVTFTPDGGDYRMDAKTFELRNDSYPAVTLLPETGVWLNSGRSLYHVERQPEPPSARPRLRLVSMLADQQKREVLAQSLEPVDGLKVAFDDNSLSFRFFSGTYAWRSPPLYQYRLGVSEPWMPVDSSMVLHFPKLRDGEYQLEVREADDPGPGSLSLAFTVAPPWYRTPISYVGYAGAFFLLLYGVARWINHRSLNRNAILEALVRDRTKELEVAMEKLNDETRNAATLAERSRLAGEIHDSLQQGLSGSILHLDTTMTHPSIPREVLTQLAVMRNMLSYSREEVQQAVWNLESPLLQNSTLSEALRKLADYLHGGSTEITVVAHAGQASLDSLVQHNLLRIAQEAITNAVKHANATRISVTLRAQGDVVILTVSDDGCGFDVESQGRAGGHFGLRGLRMRAKSIGADLEIASAPGAGTTVQVTVPCVAASPHGSPR
jgi:signal transduction histidine kinase